MRSPPIIGSQADDVQHQIRELRIPCREKSNLQMAA